MLTVLRDAVYGELFEVLVINSAGAFWRDWRSGATMVTVQVHVCILMVGRVVWGSVWGAGSFSRD